MVVCTVATLAATGLIRLQSASVQPLETGISYVYGEDPLAFGHVRET